MMDHDKQRNAEEIEKDISQSRERLDSTLHEIEERFSPQQLLNTSYEYLRNGGANEFVANLSTTIKQNPLPFLVTTAGLGWMMLSQRQPNQGPQSQQRYASASDQRFYKGQPPSPNTHGSPGIAVHEGTHPNARIHADTTLQNGMPDGASDHSAHQHDGEGRLSEMAHKAKQTAQQWGDKAHHLGDNMRDTSSNLQHGTQDSLHNMGQRARQTERQASDFIQEHPLVVGALGFALGAALGGIFPATKKEDEYMGEYRDRVLHKAAETGQEQMDKAQHSIHEKTQSLKDSGDKNGANVNAEQDKDQSVKGSPTPFSDTASPERHSPGLAGSSTPSGNTQGLGTNNTPL